jgi:hypothetical protein
MQEFQVDIGGKMLFLMLARSKNKASPTVVPAGGAALMV